VDDEAGALYVAQEGVSQAGPSARPLDEPGDVGYDKTGGLVEGHHSQIGLQGGEGIVGNLGAGGADGRQQGGFAGVGHAHDAHVGDELQLQVQPALLARLAPLGDARGLVSGSGEGGVAPVTVSRSGKFVVK